MVKKHKSTTSLLAKILLGVALAGAAQPRIHALASSTQSSLEQDQGNADGMAKGQADGSKGVVKAAPITVASSGKSQAYVSAYNTSYSNAFNQASSKRPAGFSQVRERSSRGTSATSGVARPTY